MLYQILNKYYIRVAPRKYIEVQFALKNDDVVIVTTSNKLESNGNTIITTFDFQKEKNNIKEKLINQQSTDDSSVATNKYRKRR